MEIIKGIPVSPGIVIGRVFVIDDERLRIPRRPIRPEQVTIEQTRLNRALESSMEDLTKVRDEAEIKMGAEAAKIFHFHLGMLTDPSLTGPMRQMIATELVTAEFAVYRSFSLLANRFKAMNDTAFTTKVNDIYDLSARVLRYLIGEHRDRLASLDRQAVIVARDLTPSQTAAFDRSKVAAFATDLGGRTSHTAIVAKALHIPAVVGCNTITDAAADGTPIIVDGDNGVVILDPDEERIEEYRRYKRRRQTTAISLSELAEMESVTADGVPIELLGNIEFPEETTDVLQPGGSGIGLYRTEFLYLTSEVEPSEEDHYNAYLDCVKRLEGRPLTIRTIDLGADKYTQAQSENPERNPFLGLRSIRLSLRTPTTFKKQLRAILRASAHGPTKIMFPLITNTGELRHAKWLLRDVMEDLADEGVEFDRQIKVGMMVEVPSAAIMANTFAREVDFFSIGTNDLVQYTLAVDRTNERIASMFNPAHPAVIRLIREIVKAGRRQEIPVSCCGESAAEPDYAILLIGLGLRTLSVSGSSIPALKKVVRSVTIKQCERIARKALSFDSDVEVSAYLRDQTRKLIPEAYGGRSAD